MASNLAVPFVKIDGKKITFSGFSKLSHKKFRALLKKFRRKFKRQQAARERDEQESKAQEEKERSPGYLQHAAELEREERLREEYEQHQRERLHRLWLQREEEAQKEFQRKQKIQREAEECEEVRNNENSEDPLKSEQDIVSDARRKKEEVLREVISNLPEGNESWHNPIAPDNYVTKDRELCQFYVKTGACRFGDRCSRDHPRPTSSCTLLIRGMYSNFGLDQAMHDEYDTDIGLEFEEKETYQDFKEFYDDVLPEFKRLGQVLQFKVACNYEPHLRGNVYVQYAKEEDAQEAYKTFNGRYYAGKQLSCEFTSVQKWKSAICGLFHRKKCPKGRSCNFLHVFRNPDGEFWAADRDMNTENPHVSNSSHRSYYDRSRRSRSRDSPEEYLAKRHQSEIRRYSRSYSRSRSRSPSYSHRRERSSSRWKSPKKKYKHKKKHRHSHSKKSKNSRRKSKSPRTKNKSPPCRHSFSKSPSSTPSSSSERKSRTKSPDS